jgi:hypothetical protein
MSSHLRTVAVRVAVAVIWTGDDGGLRNVVSVGALTDAYDDLAIARRVGSAIDDIA